LLDRGVEGIQVRMKDSRYRVHFDGSPRMRFEINSRGL